MTPAAKVVTGLASLVLLSGLVACSSAVEAAPAASHTVAASTPTPTYLTELPEWAQDSTPWLIYPDGMECSGTEGCPNSYRSFFGEPGPVLPEGVEYYEPAKHDGVVVMPKWAGDARDDLARAAADGDLDAAREAYRVYGPVLAPQTDWIGEALDVGNLAAIRDGLPAPTT